MRIDTRDLQKPWSGLEPSGLRNGADLLTLRAIGFAQELKVSVSGILDVIHRKWSISSQTEKLSLAELPDIVTCRQVSIPTVWKRPGRVVVGQTVPVVCHYA